MRLVAYFVLALIFGGCASEGGQGEQDFVRYARIAEAIKNADRVILYEGLPRNFDEPAFYAREIKENRTIELLGYRFYDFPVTLNPERYEPLAELFTRSAIFVPYGGPKLCGGFHPDYALEWHSGEKVFYSLVCFGCHEMIAEGSGTRVIADISDEGFAELQKALKQYQYKRPIPDRILRPIWTSFQDAKAAEIYRGVPRGVKMQPGRVIKFDGHEMYKGPKPIEGADKDALEAFLLESDPFRSHEPKKCMFHADFAITWKEKGKSFAWLTCFGCSEVKFFRDGDEFYLDLTESSDKALEAILSKYR